MTNFKVHCYIHTESLKLNELPTPAILNCTSLSAGVCRKILINLCWTQWILFNKVYFEKTITLLKRLKLIISLLMCRVTALLKLNICTYILLLLLLIRMWKCQFHLALSYFKPMYLIIKGLFIVGFLTLLLRSHMMWGIPSASSTPDRGFLWTDTLHLPASPELNALILQGTFLKMTSQIYKQTKNWQSIIKTS